MTVPVLAIAQPSGPAGGPLLVLGNSLGTSSLLWSTTVPLLCQRFRVATVDHPGHGVSPATTAPFSVDELAQGVLAAVDSLGERDFFYAGDSLGGAVGLALLLAAPQRLRAAAILCSGAKIGTTEGWTERAATVRAEGTASLVVPSATRWFAPGSIERHPDIAGRLLHSLRDADDESYALCAEALASYDLRDRLPEIAAPVLALWGEHDAVTPGALSDAIAAGVQHGRAVRVDDAAHLAPAEQPEAVASLLIDFFAGETRTTGAA